MVTVELECAAGDVVMGIDEAGRGPLAGGVYAAAVSVPVAQAQELLVGAWSGVNDSKQLSPKKREVLAEVIKSTPGCVWSVASASPAEIDELNILRATHLAMRRAALGVARQMENVECEMENGGDVGEKCEFGPLSAINSPYFVLVDGLPVPSLPFPSKNVIKGDAKSLLIAAASILAKTARDEDCLRLEATYPGYGFAKHKGYPTADHLVALDRLGPCAEHRRSFAPVKLRSRS